MLTLLDGNLNIWHKNIGVHLFKLEAHKPRCNAISWSPTDPCLFASCGDDNKIKMYVCCLILPSF